jgi:hypothetical protein
LIAPRIPDFANGVDVHGQFSTGAIVAKARLPICSKTRDHCHSVISVGSQTSQKFLSAYQQLHLLFFDTMRVKLRIWLNGPKEK